MMFDLLCLYFKYVHSVFSVFITLDANRFAVNLNFGSRTEGLSGIQNSSMCVWNLRYHLQTLAASSIMFLL